MAIFDRFSPLLGRLLLGQIFFVTGIGKMIGDTDSITQYMVSYGVPGLLFWPSSLFETVAGLAIAIGLKTRFFALLLAGFSLLVTALFHTDISVSMQMGLFLRNIAMAGGLLLLAQWGAGQYSLDHWIESRRNKS